MPVYFPPLTPAFSVEEAQDAVGAMVDATLVYVDATPSLGRAAITGDVTIAAGSNAAVIPNDTVIFAKMQNIATDRVLGRDTGGSGDIEELTLGSGLVITGGALVATGGVGASDTFAPAGPKTPIVDGDFSWFNQGSASTAISGRDGSIYLLSPFDAADSIKGRLKSAPSTPYTIIVNMTAVMLAANFMGYGLFFRDSGANKITVLYIISNAGAIQYAVAKSSGASDTGGGTYANVGFVGGAPPIPRNPRRWHRPEILSRHFRRKDGPDLHARADDRYDAR